MPANLVDQAAGQKIVQLPESYPGYIALRMPSQALPVPVVEFDRPSQPRQLPVQGQPQGHQLGVRQHHLAAVQDEDVLAVGAVQPDLVSYF